MVYTDNLIQQLADRDWKPGKTLSKDLIQLLHHETSWLNDKDPVNVHRIIAVKNNITCQPKCMGCDNTAKLNRTYPHKLFRPYCSNACATRNSRKPKAIITYSDEWLINQRVNLRRSIEDIQADLGYAGGSSFIKKQLKRLDITVDARRKTEDPTEVLFDYDKLFTLYIKEKNTVATIAKKINSSPSTVQRFLIKHNILRRSPNSYKRKHIRISKAEQEITEIQK